MPNAAPNLIVDFCTTVKTATHDQALAGAFYGYLMELAWNAGFFAENVDSPYSTTQRSGHLGFNKVLHAPQVDFLVSPYSYGFRGIGGYGAAMPPSESMRRHGKLFIFEDDTRTHLAPIDAGFGRAASPDDSVAILERNFAEVVTRGYGIWWLGNPGHIDPVRAPAFAPLLARFQELGTFALSLDRAPVAEIAMLVDGESYYYESLRSDLDLALISQQRLWGIPRLGAPTDTYLLQDLIDREPAALQALHLAQCLPPGCSAPGSPACGNSSATDVPRCGSTHRDTSTRHPAWIRWRPSRGSASGGATTPGSRRCTSLTSITRSRRGCRKTSRGRPVPR